MDTRETSPDRMTIRSYAGLFRPDRRIYQVEGHRIPWPGGLPLAVMAYAAGALAVVVLVGRAPGAGGALGSVHPIWRFVILPAALAVVAWQVRPDRRALPAWLMTQVGWALRAARRPRALTDGRVLGGEIVLPVRSETPRLDRRGRVVGRGRVVFDVPVAVRRGRRGRVVVRAARRGERATRALRIDRGTSLEVRP